MVSVEWHLTGSVAGFFLGSFLGFLGTLPDSCGILWNPSELLLIDFKLLCHELMGFLKDAHQDPFQGSFGFFRTLFRIIFKDLWRSE